MLKQFSFMNFNKLFQFPTVVLKQTLNTNLVKKKYNLYNVIEVKSMSSVRPPGITPATPKAIPYASRDLRPRRQGGILLIIPIITFGLGTWQIFRLRWKQNLIETIDRKLAMEPVTLPTLDPDEVAQMEFQRVIVKGVFDHDNEFLYGPKPCLIDGEPNSEVVSKTGEGSYGFNLVTPFILSDSGERILVNRGWIRTKTTPQEKRPWSITEGEQTITGIVRTSEPDFVFAPKSVPRFNMYHCRDIKDMAKK